ncbi:SMI1/KNR4 family protein [Alteribacter aurantiacus]|uniref:SMI1/KNR4 family protein n=1 Tax=Alteribacter aurantiacus TaxID=254410 RepID=UPI0004187405|nr:SMI1/KNR4 family protein [Alteribacter aurantiacus]
MKKIWDKDIHSEYKLSSLTSEDIEKAEKHLQVQLPKAYIALLEEQNGGALRYNAIPSPKPTVWGENHVTTTYLKGIGKGTGLYENVYLLQEWGLPEGLLLLNGDGHTWLALDYRERFGEPTVIYTEVDSDFVVKVADTFDDFLSALYWEKEPILAVQETTVTIEDANRIFQQGSEEEIVHALMVLTQEELDLTWFTPQLLVLSKHPSATVRGEVASNVWNFLSYQLEDDTLDQLVQTFQQDKDADVRMYAELIMEKRKHTFEQLKNDLEQGEMVSFLLNGEIYHVYEENKQWHLGNSESELESYSTSAELLNKGRINGQTMKSLWPEVRKV